MADSDNGELPIPAISEDYNARASWEDILRRHDWKFVRSDSDGEWWEPPCRSGRNPPGRAAVTRKKGFLTVFTTSTKFKARKSYSKFDAYAVLNHDGDRQAAAEALHSEDFGVFRKRDSNGDQIVLCRWLGKPRAYSYTWPADQEPLSVGDIVELPPPEYAEDQKLYGNKPEEAEVTELGTHYGGRIRSKVIRLVRRASPNEIP